MRVKVGDRWYADDVVPVMVEFTEKDRSNVANMAPEGTRYASFPDDGTMTKDERHAWMDAGAKAATG